MKTSYIQKSIVLSLAGVLFSGYLSAVKLLTSVCALNEPCPSFLGYPACWYGFGMFLLLFTASIAGLFRRHLLRKVAKIHTAVSTLGILFAGYFTIPEIHNLLAGTSSYALGLPTCAYGLIFYVIIFVISVKYLKSDTEPIR